MFIKKFVEKIKNLRKYESDLVEYSKHGTPDEIFWFL